MTKQIRTVVFTKDEQVSGAWLDFDNDQVLEAIKAATAQTLASPEGYVAVDMAVGEHRDKGAVSMWMCYPRSQVLSIRIDVREKSE